jgi:hypothetical protein
MTCVGAHVRYEPIADVGKKVRRPRDGLSENAIRCSLGSQSAWAFRQAGRLRDKVDQFASKTGKPAFAKTC